MDLSTEDQIKQLEQLIKKYGTMIKSNSKSSSIMISHKQRTAVKGRSNDS